MDFEHDFKMQDSVRAGRGLLKRHPMLVNHGPKMQAKKKKHHALLKEAQGSSRTPLVGRNPLRPQCLVLVPTRIGFTRIDIKNVSNDLIRLLVPIFV